ncbi:MAG: hydrogenase small subunit [Dissulfurispiraceae bacterium]|jgi:hydrogenase small subunit|nr:hydrogenase small subunit [Dissulfurispiraceae bacterium]
MKDESIYAALSHRGVSRRDFMKFCATITATLSLPSAFTPKIAEALEKKKKPYVVWLHFQDCTGDTEAILRASNPSVAELLLDIISLEYHETIMAPSGKLAEKSRHDVITSQKGNYIAIVEGSIPTKDDGIYCVVGGRTALSIAKEVCSNALVNFTVGSCAAWGGLGSANPNPTGAVGLQDVVSGAKIVNFPGCPMNPVNLVAAIVHFLTFGSLPALDSRNRPLFAYGKRIHDNCERRAHFDAGQFVRQWGDEGHRKGWCLYEMGCKGPEAFLNCPTVKFNDKTSWPVQAGHGCVACAADHNWDKVYPFYGRLQKVPGFGIETTADKVGLGLAAAAAAGVAGHAVASSLKKDKDCSSKEESNK